MNAGVAARLAAARLLAAVLDRHRPLDDALAEALAKGGALAKLEARDRAFARLLVATTLRRLGSLDAVIGRFLEHPLPARAGPARHLLRLGACQILVLDTPAHAAVDATVAAVRAARATSFAGLVNAVLRKIADQGAALLADLDAPRQDTPDWLWQSWAAAHGADTARAIATAHGTEPPLDITVRDDPHGWAGRLDAFPLATGSLRRRGGGEIAALPGFAEGAWWVQDAAAALPARLLAPVAGQTVADLCAAPGGKTAQLAAAGARVTAVDIDSGRLNRVQDNMTRLGLACEIVQADVGDWRPDAVFDGVLLDAPCTATGTIRRHPDIPHHKTAEDVTRMAAVQARLLAACPALLRPGGRLVYATCSLQPEEGADRIDAFLADGAPFTREPITADEVPGLAEAITAAGDLRTLPCHWAGQGGLDGFFVARLRRAG